MCVVQSAHVYRSTNMQSIASAYACSMSDMLLCQCIYDSMAGWDAGGTGPASDAEANKPAMQFSMGFGDKPPAMSKPPQAGAAPVRGVGAFSMSAGPRKAPVKPVVAGFGVDSDEEDG